MKKLLSVSVMFVVFLSAVAQQDPQISQNMFNRLLVNPGYAGSSGAICGTIMGRQQWMSFSPNGGTPQTFLLSLDAPVRSMFGGVGLNFSQDKVGRETSTIVNLNYAFRKAVGPGEIGIGLNGGLFNKQLNSSGWITPDGTDAQLDGSIPNSNVNNMVLDLGLGVYYNISNQLYFGLSTTHLPASTIKSSSAGTTFNYDMVRHYYVMAGYNYSLGNMWDLKPSVFVKSDATTAQVDLNCNLMWNQSFWGGATYRHKDAIVTMIGFQQASGLKIGVAYDVITSDIKNSSKGGRSNTFEFMIGYCYKKPEVSEIQKKKNVRFL